MIYFSFNEHDQEVQIRLKITVWIPARLVISNSFQCHLLKRGQILSFSYTTVESVHVPFCDIDSTIRHT